MKSPKITQVAMCTNNLPATVRTYTEVFRFADAGGELLWGDWLGEIQEVDGDLVTSLWWVVARQAFLQVELWQHSTPAPAPLPDDWRPSDLGWVRWGFAVPDFDECLERMRRAGLGLYTEPQEHRGLRRVCFRDPNIGVVVEVFEDGAAVPGGIRPMQFDVKPSVIYAGLSVPEIEPARRFLVDAVGLVEEPPNTVHDSGAGSLWGLDGADPEVMVVRGSDVFVEVVAYPESERRHTTSERRLIDQGMMNIAVGYRDRRDLDELVESLETHGHTLTNQLPPPPDAAGAYVRSSEGLSLEIMSVSQDRDSHFGFAPRDMKLRPVPSDD